MTPQLIGALIIAALIMATAMAFAHSIQSKHTREAIAWSNRQVVWELRSIALHRVHHIVDDTGMDRRRWKD
jgi:type II secretory pathway component PulK